MEAAAALVLGCLPGGVGKGGAGHGKDRRLRESVGVQVYSVVGSSTVLGVWRTYIRGAPVKILLSYRFS